MAAGWVLAGALSIRLEPLLEGNTSGEFRVVRVQGLGFRAGGEFRKCPRLLCTEAVTPKIMNDLKESVRVSKGSISLNPKP